MQEKCALLQHMQNLVLYAMQAKGKPLTFIDSNKPFTNKRIMKLHAEGIGVAQIAYPDDNEEYNWLYYTDNYEQVCDEYGIKLIAKKDIVESVPIYISEARMHSIRSLRVAADKVDLTDFVGLVNYIDICAKDICTGNYVRVLSSNAELKNVWHARKYVALD